MILYPIGDIEYDLPDVNTSFFKCLEKYLDNELMLF